MDPKDIALYDKYHLDRDDERLEMFNDLATRFDIERVLYPGCFVHVTPSFIFPKVTYVDMDRRAKRFFASPALAALVADRKSYAHQAVVQFHHQDYATHLPETDQSFDLLISQYAGFVSQSCKRYLRIGGWLLVNNSHGDAGMANLDKDYGFVGVINRRGEKFTFSDSNLGAYFIPKKKRPISRAYLEKLRRGIGYQKAAFAYVFRRIG